MNLSRLKESSLFLEHYDFADQGNVENDRHDVEDTFLKDYIVEARENVTLHGFHCKRKSNDEEVPHS